MMPHDLVPLAAVLPPAFPPPPPDLERIEHYARNSKATATLHAYRCDKEHFFRWCADQGHVGIPATPDTVAAHITALADGWIDRAGKPHKPYAASSIGRRLAAISYFHKLGGYADPCTSDRLKEVMAGIRNSQRARVKLQKAPALAGMVQKMLAASAPDIVGVRDRALIAVGFACALRRSELVALRIEDLEAVEDGYRVHIRHSKTDQSGEGQTIALPHGSHIRPVQLLKAWLDAAQIATGPIFRRLERGGPDGWIVQPQALSGHAVARTTKKLAERAGFNPAQFAGHSLRSGFLTSAAESGDGVFKLMEVSRHRSVDTLSGYVRSADLFKARAGSAFL